MKTIRPFLRQPVFGQVYLGVAFVFLATCCEEASGSDDLHLRSFESDLTAWNASWHGQLQGDETNWLTVAFSFDRSQAAIVDRNGGNSQLHTWFVDSVSILRETPVIVFDVAPYETKQWNRRLSLEFPKKTNSPACVKCKVTTPVFPLSDYNDLNSSLLVCFGEKGLHLPNTPTNACALSGTVEFIPPVARFSMVANEGDWFFFALHGDEGRLIPHGEYSLVDRQGDTYPIPVLNPPFRGMVWLSGLSKDHSVWRYSIPIEQLLDNCGFPFDQLTEISLSVYGWRVGDKNGGDAHLVSFQVARSATAQSSGSLSLPKSSDNAATSRQ